MPGALEPVHSFNIVLSDALKTRLKAVGLNFNTFDELAAEMVGYLEVKSQVKAITERLNNLTAADLPSQAGAYGLKNGSVESAKISMRKATITREGDSLTYDYNDIIKGVPSDMTVLGATTTVTGSDGNGRVGDRGNAGVLKLPSGNSAAALKVDIQTKKGIITLSSTILVPDQDGTQEVTLAVQDFTNSASDMKISEHLEVLSATVASLAQKISG